MDASGSIVDLHDGIVLWAVGLMVVVPLLAFALTEAIERLRKRDSLYVSSFETLRNVLLPALFASLVVTRILQVPEDTVWMTLSRVVQTVFWFAFAWTVLSFLSAVTAAGKADRERWEARMPTITRTIGRALAVILPFAVVVAAVWELDLTRYLAAIGVGSIAIAFALQNTLSSVISGVLLALDKPFKEGDWIEVDGNTGQVIDLNWRTTRIMVEGRDVVVIPNTTLLDSSLKNLTALDAGYRDKIGFGFAYRNMPNLVKDVALEVARQTPGVADHPPAEVFCTEYGDSSVNYEMHFHVDRYASPFAAARLRQDLLTRLFYAAARHDLEIPFPIRTLREMHTGDMTVPEREEIGLTALLAHPATATAPEDVIHRLARTVEIADYGRGTPLVEAGRVERRLSHILEGRVALQTPEGQDVMELGPGELLGIRRVVGRGANILRAVALEDVVLARFSADAVDAAMGESPELARSLNNLADRTIVEEDERVAALRDAAE